MATSSTVKHRVMPGGGDQQVSRFCDSTYTFDRVRVVVHRSGTGEPNGWSDNHVSVFLLSGNDNNNVLPGSEDSHVRSIRLNMTTIGEEDITGVLYWSQHDYRQSASRIIDFEYILRVPMKVSDLYAWVLHWGLHRYAFSGGGSGCRYWTYWFIRKLTEIHYLEPGCPQHIWDKLKFQYSSQRVPIEINIKQGTWLTEEDWAENPGPMSL